MMKNNPWAAVPRHKWGIDSVRIDPDSPFDFFWAVGKNEEYLFVIEHEYIEDWPKEKIILSGIDIQQYQTSRGYRLVLKLNDSGDWDIFYILCSDLLQAAGEAETQKVMLSIIHNRLQRWQKLFRKFGKKLLTEQEQQGLIGELHFLKTYLLGEFSAGEVLSFWRGPYGEQQDFGIGSVSVEVKTKQGTSAPYVQISSIDQLSCSTGDCFLYVAVLNTAPVGADSSVSLNGIVFEIRELLQNADEIDIFENLLAEAGYMNLPEYDEKHYIVAKESAYEVSEGFPKLSQENIPRGVVSVQYKIELKECRPFEITLEDFAARIKDG